MGQEVQKAICIFGAKFLLDQVHALEDECQGALTGEDIEHVHRMRVASRRLRNGLSLFKNCLPGKKRKAWMDEIRKITRALGKARDLDIQIEALNQACQRPLDDECRPGYNRLLLRLNQRRAKAQKKVDKTVKKLQSETILKPMRKYLEKLIAGSENVYLYTPSLYQRAFTTIHHRLADFLSYQQHIWDPENIDQLHAMRIAGKHLRYTLEVFAPIYQNALDLHIRAMKEIQDLLGEIHDNDVWISWLPQFIEKERARIEKFYGHSDSLTELLAGLNHFIADRKKTRHEQYQSFLATWQILAEENAWDVLTEIIQTPMDIETALGYRADEGEIGPDEPDTGLATQAPESAPDQPSQDNQDSSQESDTSPWLEIPQQDE